MKGPLDFIVIAFVVCLVGWVLYWVVVIAGLALGVVYEKRKKREEEEQKRIGGLCPDSEREDIILNKFQSCADEGKENKAFTDTNAKIHANMLM